MLPDAAINEVWRRDALTAALDVMQVLRASGCSPERAAQVVEDALTSLSADIYTGELPNFPQITDDPTPGAAHSVLLTFDADDFRRTLAATAN